MSKHSILTKIAFLSVSFMLTSAYAIQGALPQMKSALNITQTQSEYLATTPSFAVMFFVILSPFIASYFHLTEKKVIMTGLFITGFTGIIPFFTNDYLIILISRFFLGAGLGLYNSQAISMISAWYQDHERSSMLGWRAAAEQIGQAFTLLVAGALLSADWHASFLVYFLSFAILILFYWRVPEENAVKKPAALDRPASAKNDFEVEKISPMVYVLVIFAFILVVDFVGMENRFSGLAVSMLGGSFTGSSMFLSAMLIGATLGGIFYGTIKKYLGFSTIYLGLGLMAVSNFLFGLAGNNFVILIIGLLLVGFPLQLVSPFIFNMLPSLVPAKKLPLATSFILIGFNLGAFLSPSCAKLFNLLLGQPDKGLSLAAPFPIYSLIILMIFLTIFIFRVAKSKQ